MTSCWLTWPGETRFRNPCSLFLFDSRLDPGATHTRAKLLLEKNKADLNLSKLDYEAGRISRAVFMSRIKEGVRVNQIY